MMKLMTALPFGLCVLSMSVSAAETPTLEQQVDALNKRIEQLEGSSISPSQFENRQCTASVPKYCLPFWSGRFR